MTAHHLVLGGSGFIGRHVSILLAQAGHRVTIVSRTVADFAFPAELASRFTYKVADVATADWDSLVADVDVVHHYAWSSTPASANANPAGDLMMNVGSLLGLLDALKRRGGGRVVFASSGGTVYGKLRRIPASEDDPLAPITAYGAGKATAELYLELYHAMHGLDCRIARIANPYGAGQDLRRGLGAVTTFLHSALTGQKIVIWGDGEVVRDYVHISDVASCLVTIACAPAVNEIVFNIASGVGISLNQIITELEIRLGHRLKVSRTPTRAFDVPVSILAIDRVFRVFGWQPRLGFADGITLTLADLAAGRTFSTIYP
jgi:UDP-glucose 4-epimerase